MPLIYHRLPIRARRSSPIGTLTSGAPVTLQAVAGILTMSGDLSLFPTKALTGVLSSSGALIRKISTFPAGVLTFIGVLTTLLIPVIIQQAVAGTLTFSGNLVRSTLISVLGLPSAFSCPSVKRNCFICL